MHSIQSLIKLSPALLAVLFLAGSAPAMAGQTCCDITDIDTKTGIVGARETATGRQFNFRLTNPILVRSIKVGQGVQADFAAGKVTVVGIDGRFPIIGMAPPAAKGAKAAPTPGAQGSTGARADPSVAAQRSPPAKNARPTIAAKETCCTITAVDSLGGVVSARENATGRDFKFVANDKKTPLKGLKPGQGVYAHFASKQVSLDGLSTCCHITELAAASTDVGRGVTEQGSIPSGDFDQGGSEQGSIPSGDFDQGGSEQGSIPSGDFEQGSVSQGGYNSGGGEFKGDPGGAYGAGHETYAPGQEGYGSGAGQLQGDRPWYEKDQGPVDYGSRGANSSGGETGMGTNTNPAWTPPSE